MSAFPAESLFYTRKTVRATGRLRKTAWRLFWVAALAAVAWGVQHTASGFLTVSNINLAFYRGDVLLPPERRKVSEKEVLSVLRLPPDRLITSVNPETVRAAIAALPSVRDVSVRLILPDTMQIRIDERQPVAVLMRGDRLYAIDETGAVIGSGDGSYDLLHVSGEGGERIIAPENAFLRRASYAGLITEAIRIGRRRWDVKLPQGIIIRLPETNPEAGFETALRLQKNYQLLDRDISVLDLRVQGLIYVRAGKPIDSAAKPPA